MERICEPLRVAGVERLCGDVSPVNAPMMRLHVKQGFVATSVANSERWGSNVHFTKFLSEEVAAVFLRQYCLTPPSKSSEVNAQLGKEDIMKKFATVTV